jgi:hypothetical protein
VEDTLEKKRGRASPFGSFKPKHTQLPQKHSQLALNPREALGVEVLSAPRPGDSEGALLSLAGEDGTSLCDFL